MAVVINTKTRTELKAFFTTGSRPTAAQFGHLIDAIVNAKDDSLAKSNGTPLRLQAEQTGLANPIQKVVEFYNSFTDAFPVAELSLKSPQLPTASGLSVNIKGSSLMFFDANTSNIGIKTSTPEYDLDVNGTARLGGFKTDETFQWPNVVWMRTANTVGGDWDEGLIKVPASSNITGKSSFGLHFHHSRSFGFFTDAKNTRNNVPTRVIEISKNRISVNAGIHFENQPLQWNEPDYPKFGAFSDALGNASIFNDGSPNYNALMILGRQLGVGPKSRRYIQMWDDVDVKRNLTVTGMITPSVGTGANGIIFPEDPGGGAGDKASIQYYARSRRLNPLDPRSALILTEGTTLVISNQNDNDDNIEINASGAVIIKGVVTPSDERLKKNIEPLAYGLTQIKKLLPVSYDWKNRHNPKKSIGLLAQNVETVINEAIYANNKNETETELCLSYDSLIPVLINAVKELDQKLEAAQLKIAQLQA